jgi:multiple sugar transport system substrate-binding protein
MPHLSSLRWKPISQFALIVLSIFVLAPLAACGGTTPSSGGASGGSSGGVVNLTFASWVPNLQPVIDMFNKTHPNIHVTWQSVPAGANGTYAKFLTEIQAKNAPDLGQVEYQFLPTFETTGGLLDMSQYGASASSLKSQFVSWTWNQVTQGNSIYAIPQDTGPMAMYYRADLFKKYNIGVPKTWDDYAAAAAKLHAANSQYYITDFPPKEAGWYIGLEWQAGSNWFNINGNSWKVNINGSKQVANYWQGLLDKKLVKTDPDFTQAWYNDLQNGGAATWISAVWGANTILSNAPNTSGDWAVAPMPQWSAGQNVAGNWGGSTTVAFKNTQHPKEATEFATWLNTNSDSVKGMIQGAQLYPALTSALGTPATDAVKKFYGGQDIFSTFQQISNTVNVNFQWGPTMNQVFTDLGDNFSNATAGKTTLPASLDAVQSSTVANMQKQGFSVSQ